MSHSRSVMKILDTWLMTSSKSIHCCPGSWHQCAFGSSVDKTKSTLYIEPGCKRYHIVYAWLFKIDEVVKPQHGVQNIIMFLSARRPLWILDSCYCVAKGQFLDIQNYTLHLQNVCYFLDHYRKSEIKILRYHYIFPALNYLNEIFENGRWNT